MSLITALAVVGAIALAVAIGLCFGCVFKGFDRYINGEDFWG